MKRLCVFVFLFYMAISLNANLVENQSFEFIQPDGTVLQLLVSGDEYYHRVHDDKGYTILKEPGTGTAVYALPSGNTLQASSYQVGKVDPVVLGISPGLTPELSAAKARASQNQKNRDAGNRASPTGMVSNLIAFVRFSDSPEFSHTRNYNYYDYTLFNRVSGTSLKSYYNTVSAQQLTINSSLYPAADPSGYVVSLQASHSRNYYRPYDASTNPNGYTDEYSGQWRLHDLVEELLVPLNNLIPDDMMLDSDGDNILDAITFIIQGAKDNWGDILWPAHWSWASQIGDINGFEVTHFVINFETGLGSSVICHEMGHMIGAPDLYHYTGTAPWNGISPVSRWCLMASDNTQHWLTYMKWKYGTWFSTIPTITPTDTETTYTLQAIDSSPYSCYKIASTEPNQFYMLEYRRQSGLFDVGVPGSGLIVYRINSSGIQGNADGPPDEVYVYRPGGDVDSNGLPYSAFFSSDAQRTEINNWTDPKPWLWENTSSTPNGNLVIYDVGASGGNSISFKVRTSPFNRWTGQSSTNWHDAANWTTGVPSSTQDVIIPSSCPRYPVLTANAQCKSLDQKADTSLSLAAFTLTVSNNANLAGNLIMTNSSGLLDVYGSLNWLAGSSTQLSNSPVIRIKQDMNVASGATVQLSQGLVKFWGNTDSALTCLGPVSFNNLSSEKFSPSSLIFASGSTADVSIFGDLSLTNTSGFKAQASGTISLYGNLVVPSGAVFQCNSGTFLLDGSTSLTLSLNPADYFYNLSIAKNTGAVVSLPAGLVLKGSFSLSGGVVNASGLLKVAGNWTNTAGTAAFNEGSSSVEFNGSGHQYIYNSESFNTLVVNNGAALRLDNASTTVYCARYDWTAGGIDVISGTFTANDLVDSGIYGGYWVNPGGVINIQQDSNSYADLNGFLYNYGGTINIRGGDGNCYWAYAAPGGVTMNSGSINWQNRGITQWGTNPLTLNITGGTIRCAGNYLSNRDNIVFAGGTLELTGSGTVSISAPTNNTFYNLTINKAPTRNEQPFNPSGRESERPIDYRLDGVNLGSAIVLNGSLIIQAGTLNLGAYALDVSDDIHVYSTLTGSPAAIDCGDDFIWFPGSIGNLPTGLIDCGGNWRFEAGSNVNLSGVITTLDSADNVTIFCGSSSGWFGHLNLNGAAIYSLDNLSTNVLNITGNLVISQYKSLNLGTRFATIGGLLNLNVNAGLSIGSGGSCVINGNFVHNGSVDLGQGELIVHGVYTTANTSSMTINSGLFRNDVAWRSDRSVIPIRGAIRMYSGTYEITHNSVNIYTHATRIWSGGTFKAGVGFTATESGAFLQNGGTLELFGNDNPALTITGGNYPNNLSINLNPGRTCYLQNAITINGNLLLASGALGTNNHAISIKGTWTNLAGPANFLEGTSLISFIGNSANTGFSSDETVYNLTLNNSSTLPDNFEISESKHVSVLNDLTISDGTLNLKNSSYLSVNRDILISSGAGLNAAGSTAVQISVGGNWTDANNTYSAVLGFNPGSSKLIFNGNSASMITVADDPWDVYELQLNKNAPVNVTFSKAVRAYGNCVVSPGNWTDSAPNLNHQFYGDFSLGAGSTWPTSAQITFKGSADQNFSITGSAYINSLTVDKSSGAKVVLGSTILGLGGGNITLNAGTLDLNGQLYRSTGNVTINNGGKLLINADAEFELGDGRNLSVNSGGRLELIGSSGHYAKLSRQAGYYVCNIESGGTISADWALFEYMGSNGINVKPGALVDSENSFSNCRFQYGITGGTLLTLDNSQALTVGEAVFPANSWGGAYNVAKNVIMGTVNMLNASGDFAGESFDLDNANRISWLALPQVPTPTINYINATNRIQLSWTYPVSVTQFRIYRSSSPEGPWESAGTSTTTTWSQVVPGSEYFYKVTAEQ